MFHPDILHPLRDASMNSGWVEVLRSKPKKEVGWVVKPCQGILKETIGWGSCVLTLKNIDPLRTPRAISFKSHDVRSEGGLLWVATFWVGPAQLLHNCAFWTILWEIGIVSVVWVAILQKQKSPKHTKYYKKNHSMSHGPQTFPSTQQRRSDANNAIAKFRSNTKATRNYKCWTDILCPLH